MRRTIVTIAVSALVVVGVSVWFLNKYFGIEARLLLLRLWPPPSVEQVERRNLCKIAGWFSINCGHVRHRQNADPAISCATSALKAGKPFYVSFDYVGMDSTGATGLAANSKGTVYQVTTDQLGGGAFGYIATSGTVRTVSITPCQRPPTEHTSYPANRVLSCVGATEAE